MKSLLICGHCSKKAKNYEDNQKVILSGYADILCWSCRIGLKECVKDIARKYLDNK